MTFDEAYYGELCADELLTVRVMEGKGKGIVSDSLFREGDIVLTERALACCQNLDERRAGIPVCVTSGRSLETPEENFRRVAGRDPGELPGISAGAPLGTTEPFCAIPRVPCANAEGGCALAFASEELRKQGWERHHCVLCRGVMTAAQTAALDEFESESWIQAGVDYSDTFHLTLHIIAIVIAAVRRGDDAAAAWRPFLFLISCPWERFVFPYLLDKTSPEKPDGEKSEEERRTKEDCLEKVMRLIRAIFVPTPAEDAVLNEHRVTRILGSVLLNGQERSPASPWAQYLEWLNEHGQKQARKQVKKLAAELGDAASGLQCSARGQGIYRVGACLNHSCDPNCQVSYTSDYDETLVVYALRGVERGEEICISYIDEKASLQTRSDMLDAHYLFTCMCPKCLRERADAERPWQAPPEEAQLAGQAAVATWQRPAAADAVAAAAAPGDGT